MSQEVIVLSLQTEVISPGQIPTGVPVSLRPTAACRHRAQNQTLGFLVRTVAREVP